MTTLWTPGMRWDRPDGESWTVLRTATLEANGAPAAACRRARDNTVWVIGTAAYQNEVYGGHVLDLPSAQGALQHGSTPTPPAGPALGLWWRHRKGGRYRVLELCRLEGTATAAVLYEAEGSGTAWVRVLSEWLDADASGPRFTPLATEPWSHLARTPGGGPFWIEQSTEEQVAAG